ncbi:MAG: maleylpyruvate isomerase family mycothiol-dependent enzyme [Mycobacterium sp.]|nr:maleylpyruvate isomerase family mycothiol-dependent enzyme [Mycobacterium sp.]
MDFRAVLIEQTATFGEIIRGADPDTEVPTCPGWTLKQLFRHVGRGNRWCAQIVAERRHEPLDPREVRDGRPPEDLDGAIDWLNAGAQALVDAVGQVGADAKVWTFLGSKPAGWWIRRRVHEQTVHRADAALALGLPFELDPDLAADGVSETLDRVTAMASRADPPLARGRSLHLHAAEAALGPTGEWLVVNDEDGLNWSHQHAKGDVAVRGPATGLLLAVTRRQSVADAGLELIGDAAVWQHWFDRTAF